MAMNFINNSNDYFKNLKGINIVSNSNSNATDSDLNSEITQNLKGFNPGTKGL